jgi:hypothetical protein
MTLVLSLHEINQEARSRIGGKGYALSMMHRHAMQVPEALCISTEAYQEYVASTGLRDLIHMEIYYKPFEEMAPSSPGVRHPLRDPGDRSRKPYPNGRHCHGRWLPGYRHYRRGNADNFVKVRKSLFSSFQRKPESRNTGTSGPWFPPG